MPYSILYEQNYQYSFTKINTTDLSFGLIELAHCVMKYTTLTFINNLLLQRIQLQTILFLLFVTPKYPVLYVCKPVSFPLRN
jgi:hypothetical protein